MKSLKHVMLIASLVAIPTLSFAQQMTAPTTDTATAPAVSMHDTQSGQTAAQNQSSSHKGYSDSSGYGTQGAGSSQWSQPSATPFVGKHSPIFNH